MSGYGVICLALLAALLGQPAAAQASEAGTSLVMQAVTVEGQNQLRGRFGDKWEAEEVRARAAQTCSEAGMRLVYFQPDPPDDRGRRTFAAVCQ